MWDGCSGSNISSPSPLFFFFLQQTSRYHLGPKHTGAFLTAGLKKNKRQSAGLEAASLVISRKWLIISWLAVSTVSLADVAGRTIAVTNAQSCSKAISSFFFFFHSTEPMNSSSPRHPSSSSSKTQRMPFTLPPSASSFPSCAQAHPCQHKKRKAAYKATDTWDTQLTINSDLFMSDRSHEVVKRSPAYVRCGFFSILR